MILADVNEALILLNIFLRKKIKHRERIFNQTAASWQHMGSLK